MYWDCAELGLGLALEFYFLFQADEAEEKIIWYEYSVRLLNI